MQTITLIGSQELINTSEKYIKAMDRRHKQVALSVRIIDVSLNKSDIKKNYLEFRKGNTRVISSSGLSVQTGNETPAIPSDGSTIETPFGGVAEGIFANWLMAKITNDDAKVMASPTLILVRILTQMSGAASVDDALGESNYWQTLL